MPDKDLLRIQKLIAQKKFRKALPLVQEHLARFPEDSSALMAHAWCHAGIGEVERALRILDDAAARLPHHAAFLYCRAEVLRSAKRLDESEAAYRSALEATPAVQKHERSECLNGLGVVLWRQHKRDEALEVWRRALDEDPANKIARKNLDKFTNEYNEPATLVGAFDDPNHFRTIQTELYLQQQGKTEFSTKEETMEVIGAILQAWNEHLAPRSKEIETMTAAEKTELFGGVRVDFARQFEPPVFKQPQTVETELSDDDRHVLELFDSMFPFLPPGTGIF